jgi:type I restriction enzyme, S subunit
MSFMLSNEVNPSNVFIEQKANVLGRWDPFYFQPELVELEKRVRKATSHCLRDFVLNMAGGSTPSRSEEDLHYSNAKDGVPFLRVQNITEQGLDLSDVKYVTRNTHEGLLKRSQVTEGNLLITITGRIASAAVAPCGFEGNINQHSVVIKTASISISKTLAAFFSLGIANKLATRRSTGGTRPALDYPALLSIPIIFDERIPKLMNAAVERYQERVSEAKSLLQSIDNVLFEELGIPCTPESSNTIESRIFNCSFLEITGERLDPHFHHPEFEDLSNVLRQVPHSTMQELVQFSSEQWDQKSLFQDYFPYIEIGSVDMELGRLAKPTMVPVAEAANRAKMLVRPGDLLISLTRPTRKAITFAPENLSFAVASNGFCVIREFRNPDLHSRYLFHVLRSRLCTAQFDQRSSGGNYPAITEEQLSKLIIPLPTQDKQASITKLLDDQYAKAEELLAKSRADFEKAKLDIEALILGKEVTE